LAGRNAQAIKQLKKTLEIEDNYPQAHVYLGRSNVCLGMYAEATQEFQIAARICQGEPFYLAWLGYGYAVVGKRDQALEILGELEELSNHKYVPAYEVVFIWTALGQKDEAFTCLRKACDNRGGWFYLINVEPELKPLRSDPRFADLLRRVGFSS
jgi:tetratricopeptide (TPR) repeat protein